MLNEQLLANLAVLDEHIGQAVTKYVQARVELQRRFHHHYPSAAVHAEQLLDEQEGVPWADVSAEHDDRAVPVPGGGSAWAGP